MLFILLLLLLPAEEVHLKEEVVPLSMWFTRIPLTKLLIRLVGRIKCSVLLMGVGKATNEKQMVGSFYNCGNGSPGSYRDELETTRHDIFNLPARAYIGYCCCK